MSAALPLVVAGPLLAAVVALAVRWRLLARALAVVVPAVVAAFGVALLSATHDGSVVAVRVGGWRPGIAIPFAVDQFSALLLTVSAVLVLLCTVFAASVGEDDDRWFLPLVLVMSGGVYGAYLTADLFNLFVMIEVALAPSYVLLARAGNARALAAARLYLAVNLTASTVLLIGIGLVYASAGTVNIGELAGTAVAGTGAALAAGVVLVAFTVKAALVPAHGWLPATYPAAGPAVTALFSGLLTKVGAYGIVRMLSVVVPVGQGIRVAVIVVMVVSMVLGVLGALGEQSVRGVLTFHMVSQMGYILVGVVLAGALGMAAVVFYVAQYVLVKTSLFLSLGAIEVRRGTGRIGELGGAAERHPWVALAFFTAGLALAGLPPFSGFWAKLGLLRAALEDAQWVVFAAIILVSVGTLVSMVKVGNGVFWGTPPEERADAEHTHDAEHDERPRLGAGAVLPALLLALASLAIGLSPQWLMDIAAVAGEGLADPTAYVEAVGRR